MKAIGVNCRDRFSAEDFTFVATVLTESGEPSPALAELLTDPAARDAALDSDRLFQRLVDVPQPLPVSPRLYFYVLARHGLPEFDRAISDYIANVLAGFLDQQRLHALPGHPELQTSYLVDMLAALAELHGEAAFVTRAHVGNYTLFMAGVFPDHLRYREWVRGAPGISFYEDVGSTSYRLASDHRQARREGLAEVFRTIGDRFTAVREGLNTVADRFLHLDGSEGSFGA